MAGTPGWQLNETKGGEENGKRTRWCDAHVVAETTTLCQLHGLQDTVLPHEGLELPVGEMRDCRSLWHPHCFRGRVGPLIVSLYHDHSHEHKSRER